jgi:hypothetical protein
MDHQELTGIRAITVKQTLLKLYKILNDRTTFVVVGGYALYHWKQTYQPQAMEHDDFGDVNIFLPIEMTEDNTRIIASIKQQAFCHQFQDHNEHGSFFLNKAVCRFVDDMGNKFHIFGTGSTNTRILPIAQTLDKFDLDICRIGFRISPNRHCGIKELGEYNKQKCLYALTLSLLRLGVCRDMRIKIVEMANLNLRFDDWQSFFIPTWCYGKTWNCDAVTKPTRYYAKLDWQKSKNLETALARKQKYTKRGYRMIEVPSLLGSVCQLERKLIQLQAENFARLELKQEKQRNKKAKLTEFEKKETERLQKKNFF